MKGILRTEEPANEQCREHSADQPENSVQPELGRGGEDIFLRNGEGRVRTANPARHHRSHHARHDNGTEGRDRKGAEDDLQGEEDAGDWSVERR